MNLSTNWTVRIRDHLHKDIVRLPKEYQKRFIEILEKELSANPFSGDIQRMKGEDNVWRRRIGAYRIFYETYPREKVIYVFRIERRASKTYSKTKF